MDTGSLGQANQHWESVADSIPLLLCLVDGQGRILRVNRTLERWGLGATGVVLGRSLHETLHPHCTAPLCPLREFQREALGALAAGHRTRLTGIDPILKRQVAIDVLPVVAEGQQASSDVRAVVSIDDTGDAKRSEQGVVCLKNDVHRCLGQEAEKRRDVTQVQARLLNLISRTPNLIAITDTGGTLSYLNEAGRTMLGLRENEVTSSALSDYLTPEARETLALEALPTSLRQGMWRGPATLLARNGQTIPTAQVVVANWGPDGRHTGFSIVEQDMTAWMESETELRNSREELQRLSAQLFEIQETERRRIAADLHDVIGQSLSLIKLSIESAARLVDQGETRTAGEALRQLGSRVKDALVEVQRVSMNLRPSTLDDLGILATLSWFFREFEATCSNISVEKTFAVKEEMIPPFLKTTIFRILQEATANIVKHAGADRVRVGLRHQDDTLELTVEDNGQGFDLERVDENRVRHSLGLRSMQERARLSGGTCVLESALGHGTRIRAWWPATAIGRN